MSGSTGSRSVRGRRRTKAAAAGAVLLALAGSFGAWMASRAQAPAQVQFTAAPRARPPPPAPPPALQTRLEALAAAYGEPIGVAVTDVAAGWTAQVDGQSVYPQQSVVKLWVALAVMDAVDRGLLRLDQPVLLTRQDRSVFYQPLGARIGPQGYATTVEDLLRHSLIESDNTANDKLLEVAGGAGVVSAVLARKGITGIEVGGPERILQAKTAGLEWRPELAGWRFKEARAKLPDAVRDQALDAYLAAPPDGAQPLALTRALAALRRGELLSETSTAVLIGVMSEARTGGQRLRAGLAPGWAIAHKTGTGPDWRGASVGINDVGLITAPDGRAYAVAVMMRETRKPVPQRLALMQRVSRAVVEHWRAEAGKDGASAKS